jgi:3-hydroxyisobutyrate dehydrogenase-like beta-hydroxyacid dehydrogenase
LALNITFAGFEMALRNRNVEMATVPRRGREPGVVHRVAGPNDVDLAIDLAAELAVPIPQAQLNLEQLRAAEADGLGDRDMASIVNYLRGIT